MLRRVGFLCALWTLGCQKEPDAVPRETVLPPIPEVNLSSLEAAVRQQIDEARKALAAAPASGEANGRLGMLFDAYGWFAEASICYRRAAVLDPRDCRWPYYLGRIQAERGQASAARKTLEEALACRSDYLPTLLLLGKLSLQEDDLEEARRWFELARKVSPRSPHALLGLGEVHFKQGDTESAIRRYKSALAIAPEFGRANYSLALAYRARGEIENSRRYLERHARCDKVLAARDPLADAIQDLRRDSDHIFRSANTLLKERDHAGAIRLYRKVLDLNPNLVMANYNIGLALQQMNKHEEAIPYYEGFLRERPQYLDAHNNLGLCFLSLGDYDEAIGRFEKAVAIEPGYYKGHFNLALSLEKKGQVDRAITCLRTALSLRPRYPEAHFNLGLLLQRNGDAVGAVGHFLEVLKTHPGHEGAHLELLRRFESHREEASRPAPGVRGAARRRLAAFLNQQRLFGAALHTLRESLREGSDWRSAVTLAWMLATCPDDRLRRPEEAVRLMEPICREKAPRDPTALDSLAVAYAAVGRFDEAQRIAARALELAEKQEDSPAAGRLRERIAYRLRLYREGRAFHEE